MLACATRWPCDFANSAPMAPINAALTLLVSLEALALRAVDMPIGSSLMCSREERC